MRKVFLSVVALGSLLALGTAAFLQRSEDEPRRPATLAAPTTPHDAKLTGVAATGFGVSVAASGNTIVVGAQGDGDNGAAFVYVRSALGWPSTATAKLTASDGYTGDLFGHSVAISGDTIVVGAPLAASGPAGSGPRAGAAYVFVRAASGWANATETAKLTSSWSKADDFGLSVAIDNDTIVAGEPRASVPAALSNSAGAAYVFVKPTSGWASTSSFDARLEPGVAVGGCDNLGTSVAVSGDTVVAGAPRHGPPYGCTGATAGHGAAFVFEKPAAGWPGPGCSAWTCVIPGTARVMVSDRSGGDSLGSSVAIEGATIIAGAPHDDIGTNADQGSTYVFERPGPSWPSSYGTFTAETAKLTFSDGQAADAFGSAIALGGDTILVGAPHRDILASIICPALPCSNASQGAAYAFGKVSSGWASAVELATLIASDGGAGNVLGSSVAIAGDLLTTGAPASSETYVWTRDRPPVITVPADFAADATTSAGASVEFAASATDAVDGSVPVSCSPGSGTLFLVAKTTVTCTASDTAGNSATAAFSVTVEGAPRQLDELIEKTKKYVKVPLVAAMLTEQLENVAKSLESGDGAVCAGLDEYRREVQESDRAFTKTEAMELIADATRIQNVIGCT